jgi:hypothetical protein
MIRTIRVDNINNYITDTNTGELIEKFDPNNKKNVKVTLSLPNSKLVINGENIIQSFGGEYIIQHNNDKYILDDGYQTTLLKCGYIVYKNYDKMHNHDNGIEIRNKIISDIRKILPDIAKNYNISNPEDMINNNGMATELFIGSPEDHFNYIIRFDTVKAIVNKNHLRKDNNLPFYPFDKNMDKFGTIYVSIFIRKNNNCSDSNKYNLPDSIIRDIIRSLGYEYHYDSLQIRSRILYWANV